MLYIYSTQIQLQVDQELSTMLKKRKPWPTGMSSSM
jgi:hypothetical protein